MTASEYLSRYSGKIVKLELDKGETWIGKIASASGTLSRVLPEAVNVDFDRILDIEEYRRLGFQYKFKQETISPSSIKKVSVVDESNL